MGIGGWGKEEFRSGCEYGVAWVWGRGVQEKDRLWGGECGGHVICDALYRQGFRILSNRLMDEDPMAG